MKKLSFLLAPLVAVTLLASCGTNPSPSNEYFVSFESNGGTHVATQRVKEGSAVSKPTNPTRGKDTFNGWFTTTDFKEGTDYKFTELVNADTTLYAKWITFSPTTKHLVTFHVNGGTPVPESKEIEDGKTVEPPTEPTKTGYIFTGWFTDETASDYKYDFARPVYNDLDLYVGWKLIEPEITHLVTFHANGGTPEPEPVEVKEGESIAEPETPSKDGYTFTGWYTDEETKEYKYNFSRNVYSDLDLYAGWKDAKSDTYTVTWCNEDGTVLKVDTNVAKGTTPTYTGDTPIKESDAFHDYKFDKWFPNISEVNSDQIYIAKYKATADYDNQVYLKVRVVDESDKNITIFSSTPGGFMIYWGDGSVDSFVSDHIMHTYPDLGLYHIRIIGNITNVGVTSSGSNETIEELFIGSTVITIASDSSEGTFASCENLSKVTFAKRSVLDCIGNYSFTLCYALTSIELPESLTTIGNGAFYYCTSLKEAKIMHNVTSIGNNAFNRSPLETVDLTDFTSPSAIPTLGTNVFSSDNLKFYVHDETMKNAFTAAGWNEFGEIIVK